MVTVDFNNVYINDYFTIGGVDELNSNIKHADMFIKDNYYGCKTVEEAEIKMQRVVINNLRVNNNIDMVIGGNLSNQIGTLNMAMKDFPYSFLGVYNACSSFIESLIIGSMFIKEKINICAITSSHNLTSERQFRFPVEYGSLKKNYSTNTMTGAAGCIISNKRSNIKILSATIGSVIDYGINDVSNMGAVMAPSAANTLNQHLINKNKSIDDYDLILTGDLGLLGNIILKKILKQEFNLVSKNLLDAGSIIYKNSQNKQMGASGPTVLPYVFFNKILRLKKYKKILLIGTGALHNPTLVNQKNTIPGISHLLELEINYDN